MHETVKNLLNIKEEIKSSCKKLNIDSLPQVIAVSKTFGIEKIKPLIDHGHLHFGENKVQEAIEKWKDIKLKNPNIKLHLIGKLQSNKVKFLPGIFDFIHSLDNIKLANKISEQQKKNNWEPKVFIQVNIGNETQKNGIDSENLYDFYKKCTDLKLNIIGLMCIPPINLKNDHLFKAMNDHKNSLSLKHLSMGMSSDYLDAIKFNSTFLRIGSNIFGKRD